MEFHGEPGHWQVFAVDEEGNLVEATLQGGSGEALTAAAAAGGGLTAAGPCCDEAAVQTAG